jgi:hypothetical protein
MAKYTENDYNARNRERKIWGRDKGTFHNHPQKKSWDPFISKLLIIHIYPTCKEYISLIKPESTCFAF